MQRTRLFERGVLSRRHFLHGAGASAILALHLPSLLHAAPAQDEAPRHGGIARIRGWDPRGWDPMLTGSYRTHRPASFVYNRLFRYRAGPDVPIGRMILEPDLVEHWEEPSATRYIFHLRQGVHFHDKPPVGGREMTAEDVRYSIERFLTVKGGTNRSTLQDIDTVKVIGKYTVRVDLKQPNVWLLDYMADAMLLPTIAREVVEQFGDLKKPQAVIGTGPWLLASYARKVKSVFVKNPLLAGEAVVRTPAHKPATSSYRSQREARISALTAIRLPLTAFRSRSVLESYVRHGFL
jgi:ABC-type transport system substrate-binding protein